LRESLPYASKNELKNFLKIKNKIKKAAGDKETQNNTPDSSTNKLSSSSQSNQKDEIHVSISNRINNINNDNDDDGIKKDKFEKKFLIEDFDYYVFVYNLHINVNKEILCEHFKDAEADVKNISVEIDENNENKKGYLKLKSKENQDIALKLDKSILLGKEISVKSFEESERNEIEDFIKKKQEDEKLEKLGIKKIKGAFYSVHLSQFITQKLIKSEFDYKNCMNFFFVL
jgi:LEA14-like dessication related protein